MKSVLVVDDDPEALYVLQKALEPHYVVHQATTGGAALRLIGEQFPDLIITDLHMPGATGFEVVAAAHRLDPILPVIIVTGSGTVRSAVDAMRSGAYDYLQKPFEDLGVVRLAVERALEARTWREENLRLVQDLRRKNEMLQEQSDRLQQDLRLAQQVTSTVLSRVPEFPGVKVFARLEAARQIGGDFYDLSRSRGNGRHVECVVGDVVGKGIPAALVMVMALNIIRDVARAVHSPEELLRRTNQRICGQFLHPDGDSEVNTTVSAAVISLDTEAREMAYAKAGHEDILLWRRQCGTVETLTSRGLFLGAFPDTQYEEKRVHLEPGDRVALYTDGITETRNPRREMFGVERVVRILEAGADMTCDQLGEGLLQAASRFRAGAEQSDDIALVILELE